MKLFALILCLTSSLFAKSSYHDLYDQFPEVMGRLGSWKQGEIEITTNPSEIKKIENHCYQRLLRKGYSSEEAKQYSQVGIVAEDQYWMWVRDAVYFPGGVMGTYERIFWKTGLLGPSGAVILPVINNTKVVVNINFRHATRSWELELPRGGRNLEESAEEAAVRELKEETGCLVNKLTLLGSMAPDSGIIGGTVPVYLGTVNKRTPRQQDESEAIALNLEVSVQELKEAFIKSYLIIDIKGKKTKVYCRDPYLSFALLQATWQKLIY